MDMGVQNYLLASTLLGVLAQRLTRKLCPACKAPAPMDPRQIREAGLDPTGRYFRAVGCPECDFTGYRGRQAVGELFIIDDRVKIMLDKGLNDHEIREQMKSAGLRTISDRLRELLEAGVTSYEEAVRVGLMDG